jgi:hypothetical protein
VIPRALNVKQLRHERAGGGQAPGILHHIIIRGIERKSIFFEDVAGMISWTALDTFSRILLHYATPGR